MKICIKCKYYTGSPVQGFTCKKVKLETSLVTGITSYGDCQSAREHFLYGLDGKWWEKREPKNV